MSLRELFNNPVVTIVKKQDITNSGYFDSNLSGVLEKTAEKTRYISTIDYTNPANFARFGSAQKYYEDSINHINSTYLYDGSLKEKQDWVNSLSDLEYYLYKKEYPKVTGYVTANGTNQYIKFAPRVLSASSLQDIYNTTVENTANSFNINPTDGFTIEFWFTGSSPDAFYNTLLDLSSSNKTISIRFSANSLDLDINSTTLSFVSSILPGFNHYAISCISSSSGIEVKKYINGNRVASIPNVSYLAFSGFGDLVSGSIFGTVTGTGLVSGSIDELRIWNTVRTEREIGRHWFTHVDGNTKLNNNLCLYYKFNEGKSNDSSYASVVLDYSGRGNNGTVVNYTSGFRTENSAIDESGLVDDAETKDPVFLPIEYHDELNTYYTTKSALGATHDDSNNMTIYKSFPSWMLEEEEETNPKHLENLSQVIATYFDELYNKIAEITKLREPQYYDTETKIYPFYDKILASTGFLVPDLFVNADIIETLLNRTDTNLLDEDLFTIKNKIYQNIYNNINYINKSKGTEKSLKSLLRAYGIGDNVVKLNLYGDGAEYEFKDTFTNTGIKKKLINFIDSAFTGSIFTNEYIRPLSNVYANFIPFTLETQVIFPKKDNDNILRSDKYTNTVSSLFGIHTSNGTSDYTWNDTNGFDCIVYAEKESAESTRVKFRLTSSILGVNLTSSYIDGVYNDDRWNFAVRIQPTIKDYSYVTTLGYTPSYMIHFYGSSYDTDVKSANSFDLSTTLMSYGSQALTSKKNIYFGAHRTNFTGSLLTGSDVKFVSAKYWADFLSNEELDYHAKDISNSGRLNPSFYSFISINDSSKNVDTLVANWDFDALTGSNSSGEFTIENSVKTLNSDYTDFIYPIRNTTYNLTGKFFKTSSNDFLSKLYTQSTKQNNPETLNSSDMINVVSEDDESFTGTGKKPEQYFFAIEHSMYQSISDEMLRWLSSVVSFNNLVGESKNKFTENYNELNQLRNKFFDYVEEKPSIEKYIQYYKWIDSSLGYMLGQLKPATAMGVRKLAPVVESHIFERNKVTYSLPYFREKNRQYEVEIAVVDNTSMSGSEVDILSRQSTVYNDPRSFLTTDRTIVNTKNVENKNYKKKYEYVQTAGKKINNRTGKENDTVITVNFSAGDGLSDTSKHETFTEYSPYNSLNSRAGVVRSTFNATSATTSSIYVGVNSNAVSTSKGDRYDNDFKQYNIPAKDTGFYQTSSLDYMLIPSGTILSNRYSNTIKVGTDSYIEPPVQWTIPMVHNMTVSGAFENIEISSPYNTVIDGFANTSLTNRVLTNAGNLVNGNTTALVGDDVTFYNTAKTLENVNINTIEYSQQIFPKKEIVGLAVNRTKPNYEEVAGTGSNGYDRNIGEIRSFWKDSINDRSRRSVLINNTGSINCLNYTIYKFNTTVTTESAKALIYYGSTTPYYYNRQNTFGFAEKKSSIYNLDNISSVYTYFDSSGGDLEIDYSSDTFNTVQGELASITISDKIRNAISQSGTVSSGKFTYSNGATNQYRITPKIQIANINYNELWYYSGNNYILPINKNYQYDSGSFITAGKKPFFNSYNDYYQSIKKYANYSNLPEYTFHNISNTYILSNSLDYTGSFLKRYGLETDTTISELSESNFDTNLINFIDPQTNKIKIKLEGVKKLLPYRGFYAHDRTVQITSLFEKSYLGLNSSDITSSFILDETGTPLDQQVQTLIQPLFAPGILFNTIKAGLAVDWPTFLTSSDYLSSNTYLNKPDFYNSGSYNTFHSTSYIIDKTFNARIPFETILNPPAIFDAKNYLTENTSSKNILFYLDPTVYSGDNFREITSFNPAYPKITNNNKNRKFKGFDDNNTEDPRYKLSMHNFLAEVPNFFLKNNSLTSFISSKKEPLVFDTNKEYRMDIKISKNSNFSMFSKIAGISDQSIINALQVTGSLFGVPTRSYNSINTTSDTSSNTVRLSFLNALSESSYAPFVPPYFLGDSTLTLIYKPTTSSINLDDIFNNLQYSSSFSTQILNLFSSSAAAIRSNGEYSLSPSYNSIMKLDSCLNIKSKAKSANIEFNNNQTVNTVTPSDNFVWTIQTKFETPLIDYTNKTTFGDDSVTVVAAGVMNNKVYKVSDNSTLTNAIRIDRVDYGITGIWSSYGSIPSDGQSVQLSLDDSKYSNNNTTGSLLELCGFQRETKSIGQLAEEKEISEAVVMIPYKTNKKLFREESFDLLKPQKNILTTFSKKIEKLKNTLKNKKYRKDLDLIPVDERVINKLLGIENYKTQKIENLTTIIERLNSDNSIVKLMKAMVKYNLPPHLNWLEDTTIDPFVMYIFEFTHTLDKQDLADIWQGVMPKISTQHEEQEIEIEHSLTSDELFGGLTVEELKQMDIKFKVFKIKRRANINYYKLTADSADDENFKFKFGNNQQEVVPYYSYNWPYDYFSLVELVKIEAGGVVDKTPKVLTDVQVLNAVDSGDFKVAGTPLTRLELNNNLGTLIRAAINSGSNG